MRFEHEGKGFRLEFSREFKEREVFSHFEDEEAKVGPVFKMEKSRWPYTSVNILAELALDGLPPAKATLIPYRTYTVGCHSTEKVFNPAVGRLAAMRMVTKGNSMSKDFKKSLWKCFVSTCRLHS